MSEYIEKTQKELGAIISVPKLTEKLLSKPPFRFLHDVVTSFLKTTGFPDQLYDPDMLDSGKVSDKESKIEFLRRLIAVVEAATKQPCPAKPAKIVAGHEPENTNLLLQMLAQCASLSNEQKAQAVRAVTAKSTAPTVTAAAPPPAAKQAAEKEAVAPVTAKKDAAPEKRSTTEGKEKKAVVEPEKKAEPELEKRGGVAETKKQAKAVEAEEAKKKARPHTETETGGTKEGAEKSSAPAVTASAIPAKRTETDEERHARHEEERRRRHEERKRQERMAAEARRDAPAAVAEDVSTAAVTTEEAYVPVAESRRRREAENGSVPGGSHRGGAASRAESGATTSTTTTASAGKAPPRTRPTHEVMAAQAGLAAAPAAVNVIIESKQGGNEDDEDDGAGQADWQKVAENFGRKQAGPAAHETRVGAETEVKGALAQQALQAKKAQDAQNQQQQQQQSSLRQPESGGIIIRSSKAAQAQAAGGATAMAEGDLSKLREQLQLLTKASNPLGKFLEAIHDDLDSMTRELAMWRSEARSQLLAAADARRQTHESLQEIQANVLDLENAITDQESKINFLRRNIIANDKALGGMVHMIVHPEAGR